MTAPTGSYDAIVVGAGPNGLVAATRLPKDNLCRACFDGVYPVELPLSERIGHPLADEGTRTDADGLSAAVAGVGAADALSRP